MNPPTHQKDYKLQHLFFAVSILVVIVVAFVGVAFYRPLTIAGLWIWMGGLLYVISEDIFVRE